MLGGGGVGWCWVVEEKYCSMIIKNQVWCMHWQALQYYGACICSKIFSPVVVACYHYYLYSSKFSNPAIWKRVGGNDSDGENSSSECESWKSVGFEWIILQVSTGEKPSSEIRTWLSLLASTHGACPCVLKEGNQSWMGNGTSFWVGWIFVPVEFSQLFLVLLIQAPLFLFRSKNKNAPIISNEISHFYWILYLMLFLVHQNVKNLCLAANEVVVKERKWSLIQPIVLFSLKVTEFLLLYKHNNEIKKLNRFWLEKLNLILRLILILLYASASHESWWETSWFLTKNFGYLRTCLIIILENNF